MTTGDLLQKQSWECEADACVRASCGVATCICNPCGCVACTRRHARAVAGTDPVRERIVLHRIALAFDVTDQLAGDDAD